MRFDAKIWFGIMLAAGLLFLWCLISAIEAQTLSPGWTWGLLVFGLITLIAAGMALLRFASSGKRVSRSDLLTSFESSPAPRSGHGRALVGGDARLMGSGDVPRRSSGRDILR